MRFRPNRPRRRGLVARLIAGPALDRLSQANQLLEAGQPQAAAQAFGELAQQVGADGQFKRAVQLHLRAGELYAQLKDGPRALAEARAALAWLKRLGRDRRAGRLGWRVVDELRAAGLPTEAEALAHELTHVVGGPELQAPAPSAPARGRLPARCSQCGGPVRADEVEWIDAASAECPYCGSTLLAD